MRPLKQYRDTCLNCGHVTDLTEKTLGNAVLPCVKCRSMNRETKERPLEPTLPL